MKDELKDLGADMFGPGLDLLLDSKAAESIPWLGSALKLVLATASIPNLRFAAKVRSFIEGTESISREEREKMYLILSSEPEKVRLAGETIIDAVDRADSRQKAAIVGRLFAHHVLGGIDLSKLRRLLFAVDRAFLKDLLSLPRWSITGQMPEDFNPRSLDGTGLVDAAFPNVIAGSRGGPKYGVAPLGQIYSQFLFGFTPA